MLTGGSVVQQDDQQAQDATSTGARRRVSIRHRTTAPRFVCGVENRDSPPLLPPGLRVTAPSPAGKAPSRCYPGINHVAGSPWANPGSVMGERHRPWSPAIPERAVPVVTFSHTDDLGLMVRDARN